MSEEKQKPNKGPFIAAELRPQVGLDLEKYPPLEPGTAKEEIQRRAAEILGEEPNLLSGLADEEPRPEIWKTSFTRSPEVEWVMLDEEAVLLNLETAIYYSLNRVGAVIWELLGSSQPLEGILGAICKRFDVTKNVARKDLRALVISLCQEKLIVEEQR